jgi:hypothetical protein
MRIKKKYVLLESRLIDVTSEFTPQEKRILEMLHKKYGENPSEFNMWYVAVDLIEDFNLDYETAYSLARTYSWSWRELFGPSQLLRKTLPIYELFFDNLNKLIDGYSKIHENEFNVRLRFNGDVGLESIENRNIILNDGYHGFNMFISVPAYFVDKPNGQRYYLTPEENDYRTLSVYVDFSATNLDGENTKLKTFTSDEEAENINKEEFKVTVTYKDVKNTFDKSMTTKLLEFNVPYPKPLTKESAFKVFDLSLKDVIDYMSNTTFDLPKDVEPIVIEN